MLSYQERHSGDDYMKVIHAERITIPAHLHNSVELVYCNRGNIRVSVEQESFFLSAGMCALIPRNTVHSYESGEFNEIYALLIGQNFISDMVAVFRNHRPARYQMVPDTVLADMLREYFPGEQRSVFSAKALLYRACQQLLAENPLLPAEDRERDAAIQVLLIIQNSYLEPITLMDISRQTGYNYYYISKQLKTCFGTSFPVLLSQFRIAYAKTLLRDQQYSVSETALLSGFGSIRNFNRIFRSMTGTTPAEYAKGEE